MAFEVQWKNTKIQVKDRELLRSFEMIDNYSEEKRKVAKEILDLVIMKHRFQKLASSHS